MPDSCPTRLRRTLLSLDLSLSRSRASLSLSRLGRGVTGRRWKEQKKSRAEQSPRRLQWWNGSIREKRQRDVAQLFPALFNFFLRLERERGRVSYDRIRYARLLVGLVKTKKTLQTVQHFVFIEYPCRTPLRAINHSLGPLSLLSLSHD